MQRRNRTAIAVIIRFDGAIRVDDLIRRPFPAVGARVCERQTVQMFAVRALGRGYRCRHRSRMLIMDDSAGRCERRIARIVVACTARTIARAASTPSSAVDAKADPPASDAAPFNLMGRSIIKRVVSHLATTKTCSSA